MFEKKPASNLDLAGIVLLVLKAALTISILVVLNGVRIGSHPEDENHRGNFIHPCDVPRSSMSEQSLYLSG